MGALAISSAASSWSEAAGGTASREQSAQWSGQLPPISDSSQVPCRGVDDPRCDAYGLTIDAPHGAVVSIEASARSEFDDLVVEVHTADGGMIAGGDSGNEVGATFVHGADQAEDQYLVLIRPTLTNLESTAAGGIEYDASASVDTMDNEPSPCPDSDALPPGIAASGADMTLDVLVLADGVDVEEADGIAAGASQPFEELGITMTWEVRPVTFVGTSDKEILAQAKRAVGGVVPPEFDVVHTITARDLDGVAGSADCVGGIKSAQWAFSTGETSTVNTFGLFPWDNSAVVMAHEIGHLLGAHHHLFTCTEPAEVLQSRQSVCTLMGPDTYVDSLHFSPLNGQIVTVYAERWA